MDLDKRIKEGKRPLTCFDIEEAKAFLGKECYFSNAYCTFEDLNSIPKAILQYVSDNKDASDPYKTACYYYPFCLPCEWVEEKKEPKYRAYTMSEFKAEFKLGMVLTLRDRNAPDYVYQVMYLGNRHYDDTDSDENAIFLSQRFFSLRELFNIFEIVRNGEWQPFGVLEE